jgi:hypothetical protein
MTNSGSSVADVSALDGAFYMTSYGKAQKVINLALTRR